jgi:hypothetical protein
VKSRVNGGGVKQNHNESVAVKTRVNGGAITSNHSEAVAA